MKRVGIAAIFAIALSSVVFADDRGGRAACCAPFNWTALYVGTHAGFGEVDISLRPPPGQSADTPPSPTGGLWGAHLGANYQFAHGLVLGIEIDGAFARLEDTRIAPDPQFPQSLNGVTAKVNSLTTLRGRVGYAWDRTLFYATAGGAWTKFEATTASSNTPFVGPGTPRVLSDEVATRGWVIGAGIERALWSNWTGRLEYLHVRTEPFTVDSQSGTPTPLRFDLQAVRAGLSYRLN
jgi:opacity protein-like surface antigen